MVQEQNKMIYRTGAPAKFNRFLSVLGRRPDGFHLLELVTTVLHGWPSLRDNLTAEIAPSFSLEVKGPASAGIGPDESNLVVKAWRSLEKQAGRPLPAKIELLKRIPPGAGLGGGSSDAAAALRAGNSLYQLGLKQQELLQIAAAIGADVPLFLLGGTVLGLDLGQRVFPMRGLALPPMLIAHPGIHLETAFVYKALAQSGLPPDGAPCPSLGPNGPPPWHNGLTDAALSVCPELGQVRDALLDVGGDPILCGSGSCWAAKFAGMDARDAALDKLKARRPEWDYYIEGPIGAQRSK
jgi:4-diphosphocytidyl-2-C-methyl-D-erythritol kinase